MVENSTTGLVWLAPDNTVVVTREEFHQPALQRYAPRADGKPRKVGVELRIAPISHGRHTGEPGIEIWLDGRQVGELTALMSRRYGPVVTEILRRGDRPGAEARVVNGPRGVEVEVRLPDLPTGAHAAPPVIPPAAPPRPSRRRVGKPFLIGAGVVVGLLVISGIINGRSGSVPTTPVAASAPSTTAPPPAATPAPVPPATTEPQNPVAQTSVAQTSAAQTSAAQTSAAQNPAPKPASPPVAQPPAPKPQPAPAAEPANDCDPNYSGCVPIASDVDCEGGSGNGPAYVRGPVRVTGSDIYDLDRDNDKIACE